MGSERRNDMKNDDHPEIIAFPPLIFLVWAAVGVGFHFVRPMPLLPRSLALWIGIGVLGVAGGLAISAYRAMILIGTNIRPDQPTLAIARSGPYRFTRNPMYLGLCLLLVATGFLFDDWVVLLMVIPLVLVLHFGVVLREERYLEAKFGEAYLELKREVRRWV